MGAGPAGFRPPPCPPLLPATGTPGSRALPGVFSWVAPSDRACPADWTPVKDLDTSCPVQRCAGPARHLRRAGRTRVRARAAVARPRDALRGGAGWAVPVTRRDDAVSREDESRLVRRLQLSGVFVIRETNPIADPVGTGFPSGERGTALGGGEQPRGLSGKQVAPSPSLPSDFRWTERFPRGWSPYSPLRGAGSSATRGAFDGFGTGEEPHSGASIHRPNSRRLIRRSPRTPLVVTGEAPFGASPFRGPSSLRFLWETLRRGWSRWTGTRLPPVLPWACGSSQPCP
jgi:hypothetical protein